MTVPLPGAEFAFWMPKVDGEAVPATARVAVGSVANRLISPFAVFTEPITPVRFCTAVCNSPSVATSFAPVPNVMVCGAPPPTETVRVLPFNPCVSRLVGGNVWFEEPKPRSAASLAPLPVTETVEV